MPNTPQSLAVGAGFIPPEATTETGVMNHTPTPATPDALPDGWTRTTLGENTFKIGSGATPRGGKEVYLDSGEYSLIRSQNVYNERFEKAGLAYIGERHAQELKNVEVCEQDILLNITGDSVARSCQVPQDILPARVNQHVAIIRTNSEKLHPRFLRFRAYPKKLEESF